MAPAAPVSRTFTVNAAPLTAQTITFVSPGNQTLGTAPPALSATSSSGLSVSFASTTTPVCTVSANALTLVAAGSCTIVASQAGNSSFAAATNVSQTFTVAAAPVATINAFGNGGFEIAADNLTPSGGSSPNEFAEGWLGNQIVPTRSAADPRSGSFSARIAIPDPGNGGSGLSQNSVEQGGLALVSPANWGTSPALTFWIRGNSSFSGNLNYALRYLSSTGAILNTATAGSRTIWTGNTVRPWTQVTLAGIVIPANTTAILLEMTMAVGSTGTQPPGNCGVDPNTGLPNPCDNGQAEVYLDDVNLQLLP